ncbi:MAG: hypothetical protein HZA51_10770 [Planctomycetes bacterium]|nr:hypothetical protein [Planctomycetota bacterium]
MTYKRFRKIRRIGIILAALPLMQAGACITGLNQVAGNTLNSIPSVTFNAALSTALLPAQVLLALLTGGFGGGNLGGGSGIGGGGIGGGGIGGGGGI